MKIYTNKSILLALFICSISFIFIILLSCSYRYNKSIEGARPHIQISMTEKNIISMINTKSGLCQNLIDQIEPKESYFAKLNYANFSSDAIIDEFELTCCRLPDPDLWIDYRLLNDFVLVFTKQDRNSIYGYVKQVLKVETPLRNGKYLIYADEMLSFLGDGMYDIYGFYNDTLVLKNTYSPNIFPSFEFIESESKKNSTMK